MTTAIKGLVTVLEEPCFDREIPENDKQELCPGNYDISNEPISQFVRLNVLETWA